MRKFLSLVLLCLALPVMAAGEDQLPAREALKTFKEPMLQTVREAAKGDKAALPALRTSIAAAKDAWFKVTAQPLDLDAYGIPADQQEEVWRQLRTVGLMVEYLDEGARRGDLALIRRATGLVGPAYDKVAAAFKIH